MVHGGIVASIVDEALGRSQMGSDGDDPRFMYTARLTVHYRKPVPIGQPIRIVGRAIKSKRRSGTSTASIFGPDGDLLVDAEALLIDVQPEMYKSEDLESLGWKVYPIDDQE
jgi:acyl-coenzyme A thioesterase PaaI-like protein